MSLGVAAAIGMASISNAFQFHDFHSTVPILLCLQQLSFHAWVIRSLLVIQCFTSAECFCPVAVDSALLCLKATCSCQNVLSLMALMALSVQSSQSQNLLQHYELHCHYWCCSLTYLNILLMPFASFVTRLMLNVARGQQQ